MKQGDFHYLMLVVWGMLAEQSRYSRSPLMWLAVAFTVYHFVGILIVLIKALRRINQAS